MKQIAFTRHLESLPLWSFFLLLFIYQLLFTFQGLDLSDVGFNAIFYQQIYENPLRVQYSFMFWLAGVIGGAFGYLFPGLGLWGFSLLAALTTTGTIIVTYHLLKNHLGKGALRLGLLLALLVISNNIKIFHYNYLCTLWYVITASLLFTGLKKGQKIRIFFSGAIIALEVFTRLPSIVDLGLVIVIFYYGYLNKTAFRQQLGQALSFVAGFLVCVALILLIMQLTGQLTIFVNALQIVVQMGSGGEESQYGILKLVKQFFVLYGSGLKYTLIIALPVIAGAMLANSFAHKSFYRKWLVNGLTYLFLALLIILVITNVLTHLITVFVFTILSLVAGILIIIKGKNKEIQALTLIGCYILLTYPLGSSDGIYTVGVYALWIALPIGVDYFSRLRSGENHINVQGKEINLKFNLYISRLQLQRIGSYGILICIFACLYQAYYYPFFDTNERLRMRYSVDNKLMEGIYTTRERAEAVNELLYESAKYIHPGDRVLAYHSIPMFHYMTETKPYLRNSMPWLYEGSFFRKELKRTAKKIPVLPVIVVQLTKTVGDASNWPDPPAKFDKEWDTVNKVRDIAMREFETDHHYKEVWRNSTFSILVPPAIAEADSLLSE